VEIKPSRQPGPADHRSDLGRITPDLEKTGRFPLFESGKNQGSSVWRIEVTLEADGKLIDVGLSIALTPNPPTDGFRLWAFLVVRS
jgi:hypothetical protein